MTADGNKFVAVKVAENARSVGNVRAAVVPCSALVILYKKDSNTWMCCAGPPCCLIGEQAEVQF